MMERIAELFSALSAQISKMPRILMVILVFIIIFSVVDPLNVLLAGALLLIWLHARYIKSGKEKDLKDTVKPSFAFKGKGGFNVDQWFDEEGFDAIFDLTKECEGRGNRNCTLNRSIELPSREYWLEIAEMLRGYGFICDIADGDFYIAWGLS